MLALAPYITCAQDNTKSSFEVIKEQIEVHYNAKQWDSALQYSQKLLKVGIRNNQPSQISEGYHFLGYYQKKAGRRIDAFQTYQKGINYSLSKKDTLSAVKMSLNAAGIQNDLGYHTGAQKSASLGLELNKTTKDTLLNYQLYKSLGNTFQEDEDYYNAIMAYDKAIKVAPDTKNKISVLNSKANTLRKQKKINAALSTYNTAIKDSSLLRQNQIALLLDNYGYTLMKTDEAEGAKLILDAQKRYKLLDNTVGLYSTFYHLSDGYKNSDPIKALAHAEVSYKIAKSAQLPAAQLSSLKLLLVLKENPSKESKRFIELHDSIEKSRKENIHAFAGVTFRTKELDAENQKLEMISAEETQRKWFFAIGLALASILALILYRRYISEKRSKEIITSQKDEIEIQKNLVVNLQKELHHRLKNNLGFIDVFISLAKGKFKDIEYQDRLTELQNRIKSMFEIHEQLFQKENVTSANAATYINKLVANVSNAYETQDVSIQKEIDEQLQLNSQTLFPIGIIVNEFITNSYKYAFDRNTQGLIHISLKEGLDTYTLELRDNGKGLPKDFNLENLNSFGIDAMRLLAEEYAGTFNIENKDGVTIIITIPNKENI